MRFAAKSRACMRMRGADRFVAGKTGGRKVVGRGKVEEVADDETEGVVGNDFVVGAGNDLKRLFGELVLAVFEAAKQKGRCVAEGVAMFHVLQ